MLKSCIRIHTLKFKLTALRPPPLNSSIISHTHIKKCLSAFLPPLPVRPFPLTTYTHLSVPTPICIPSSTARLSLCGSCRLCASDKKPCIPLPTKLTCRNGQIPNFHLFICFFLIFLLFQVAKEFAPSL